MIRHESWACFSKIPVEFDINAKRRSINFIVVRHVILIFSDFSVKYANISKIDSLISIEECSKHLVKNSIFDTISFSHCSYFCSTKDLKRSIPV